MYNRISFIIVPALAVLIAAGLAAQTDETKIPLLDFGRAIDYLELSDEQIITILPMIEEMTEIMRLEEELRGRMREAMQQQRELPDMAEMQKRRQERQARIDRLGELLDRMREELTESQRKKLEEMELPEIQLRMGGGRRPF